MMRSVADEGTQTRLSKAALAAFALGASSLVLSLVTALPGLFFGVQAIRTINLSGGRLHGQRLAIAGLVLSALSTVLTILGLLGMVLLNVQEISQVAACTNNLRRIGEAIHTYRDHNDHYYPPGTVPNVALKPQQRLSWEVAIIPYFGETGAGGKKADKNWEKLVGEIAFKEAWDAPANAGIRLNVMLYLCPTFAHELSPGQVGLTSYVGVAGVGEEAATLPRSDANAGFFGYERLLRESDVSARLDATMMAIETLQANGPWSAGGPSTVRGFPLECNRYIGKDAVFGGLHRAGANVLWADGSVHIVTDKVDPDIFRQEARITR
jgi:prepilin-type processing-associated H-X9-DG protein